MTNFRVDSCSYLPCRVTLDWGSKKIVAWLEYLFHGVDVQFSDGVREAQGLKLVSDNGSQPTSMQFVSACLSMKT